MRKSKESHEKIHSSTPAADLCRHVCSRLFSEMVSDLRPEWVATRPWLAFQAKAMVKIIIFTYFLLTSHF